MPDYYSKNKKTIANCSDFFVSENEEQHFPVEGLYIGELLAGNENFPALVDLQEIKGLCFLHNNEKSRTKVNQCLERLVWRIALAVPSNLCDIIMYVGDNIANINSCSKIDSYLLDNRKETIFFDGNSDKFSSLLEDAYNSIVERLSIIKGEGKRNLVELNASLGNDARIKYRFFIINDFPNQMTTAMAQKLHHIVTNGNIAGIYVLMTWDMNADFIDNNDFTQSFNPQKLLMDMELLVPKGDSFSFRNSGHDEVLNRFRFSIDDNLISKGDIEKIVSMMSERVETAKKQSKNSILKQDFANLKNAEYEPVMSEISVTVGLDINDKNPVTLRFNSGDYIHAFILGQSGSGKSVLLNNIITSAVLKYSPEDLMMYLMDFKGVEFNKYKGLKHTKAVLVDNGDPQMTLEVLRELDEENKRRVKLWRKEGVSNIEKYNKKYPNQRIPQILFVADECQVLFKPANNQTNRQIQKEISDILNTIATQGRSQGIHMLLATQQLDETDISGQVLKNLTECFLLMSAPSDAERLVPDSSELTAKQTTGVACYYHKKEFQSQVQTFYANDEELAANIEIARQKAKNAAGNGEYYFCGSSMLYLKDYEKQIEDSSLLYPVAIVGENIGINAGTTQLPICDDYYENILFFGVNKQEQTVGVLLNALISLIISYRQKNIVCRFYVIDCYNGQTYKYKKVLDNLEKQGLCQVINRQSSSEVLCALATEIKNNATTPAILAIIGQEKYIEVKRNVPLVIKNNDTEDTKIEEIKIDTVVEDQKNIENNVELNEEQLESLLLNYPEEERELYRQALLNSSFSSNSSVMIDSMEGDIVDLDELSSNSKNTINQEVCNMTYQQVLAYILEEGPSQGIHVLMQVDKPGNIFFEGDYYNATTTEKFRHKIILRSENKFLQPMRMSEEIDVENLNEDEERLRAYYYPEGEKIQLFTPFQIPEETIIY